MPEMHRDEHEQTPLRYAPDSLASFTVGLVISPEFPEPALSDADLGRFQDMPNRRQSLRATDSDNLTVFISHAIARKLYRCPCCREDIPIGREHAVVSRIQLSKAYSHHHVDTNCVQGLILPRLTQIEVVDPGKASASEVNRRARRYRHRNRGI